MADIPQCRIVQTIKIMRLDDVEIDEHDVFEPRSSEALSDHPAHASGADDAHPQPRHVRLTFVAPGRNGSDLLLGEFGHWGELVVESRPESFAHNPNGRTPGHRIGTRSRALPEPCT